MDTLSHDEIKRLMERAKQGDEVAFGIVYERYFTPVFRYIRMRINDHETAEDLTQTTFLKIYRSLDRFEVQVSSPLSYFFTVARNTVFDFYKKKKDVTIEREDGEESSNMFDQIEDREMGPQAVLEEQDKNLELHEAIKKLKGDQKEVIYLKFIKELSNKEIAEILKKSEMAVRQAQCRGLKKLQEYLNQ